MAYRITPYTTKKSRSHGGFLRRSQGHRQFSSLRSQAVFGWSQIVTPVAALSAAHIGVTTPCDIHLHTFTPSHPHSHLLSGMFACFGFLSLYLSGKLHCFRPAGRGQAWRLCAAIVVPLLAACVVGISRIQDHKHHWEGRLSSSMLVDRHDQCRLPCHYNLNCFSHFFWQML